MIMVWASSFRKSVQNKDEKEDPDTEQQSLVREEVSKRFRDPESKKGDMLVCQSPFGNRLRAQVDKRMTGRLDLSRTYLTRMRA